MSRIAHVLTYRSKDAVCVSAGYLRIRRCEVVRYDGLTTVPYPSYCLAVTRRRRIVVLVEREFIVSGGLGRCSTMTKLTVESLSRNPSDTFVSFSVTQILRFLSFPSARPRFKISFLPRRFFVSYLLWIPDPVTAVDKSNPLVTVSLSHALLSPIS